MKTSKLLPALSLLLLAMPAWAQRIDQLKHGTASSSVMAQPAAPTAMVQQPFTGKIAAIVNDGVISTFDIEQRVKLSLLSSGLPDNAEVRARLIPQSLRSLIEEQLQLQEAKRLELTVSESDINTTLDHIAQDNHIPGGDMRAFLRARGVSPESLASQIRAGLSWNKVIQRELRPRVEVGDDEVDAMIERIRADAGKQEYAVSEIFLAVDSPQDEEQVHQLANNLASQIKGGTNFAAIAHQFSQESSATTGGDIGWIQDGQLSPDLNHTLAALKAGEVSDAVRSADGYHILALREQRTVALGEPQDTNIELQQAFRPLGNAKPDTVLAEAEQIRSTIKNCTTLHETLDQQFPLWKWQSLGTMKQSKAPAWIADKIRDVAVGQSAEPMMTEKGGLLIFVCKRATAEATANREALTAAIGTEKLELQARRLLRDLRRSAYIDIRRDALPE